MAEEILQQPTEEGSFKTGTQESIEQGIVREPSVQPAVLPTVETITPEALPPVAPGADKTDSNLNLLQTNVQTELEKSPLPVASPAEVAAGVEASLTELTVPEAPNLSEFYTKLRQEKGLNNLEGALGELQELYREGEANLRIRKSRARGGVVPMDVIGGRVGEIERQEMENLDFMGRQIQTLTGQIEAQNQIIDTFMNIEQMDYDNALNKYNAEFNQRLETQRLMQAERQITLQEDEFEFKQNQWKTEIATTHVNMYADMIAKGQLTWEDMDQATKNNVNKMEIQAGLGIGFTSKITPPPGSNIIGTYQRQGADGYMYADVVYSTKDGIVTESKRTGKYKQTGTGGGGTSAGERTAAKSSNFLKLFEKGGSAERESTIRTIQRFDTDGAGKKTTITEDALFDAIDYLASREGISIEAANSAIQNIARKHHYTIT